jgi:hypothetical protein
MNAQAPNPDGEQYDFTIRKSINTDNVNENIYPINDGPAALLTNTGILHDNGVTNLYQTAVTDSNGQYVMYAQNGAKISLDASNASGYGRIFINGNTISGTMGVFTYPTLSSRVMAPLGAIDFAMASSGNWLLLAKTEATNTAAFVVVIYEYNQNTGTIVGSKTLTFTGGQTSFNYIQACFVKGPQMTLSNADVACIFFNAIGFATVQVTVSGVVKNVFGSAAANNRNFTGISAYTNNGAYIVGGIPDTSSMPRSYSSVSPYTVWTPIAETSYLYQQRAITYSQSNDVSLTGIPSSKSSANFTTFSTGISVTTIGTIVSSPSTVAGLSIIPANARTSFNLHSGIYKSTASTKFGGYIVDQVVIRKDQTVTDYGMLPQSASFINNGIAGGLTLRIYGIDNNPAYVVLGDTSSSPVAVGAPICEIGNMSSSSPVGFWCPDFNGSFPCYVSIPTMNGVMVCTITNKNFAIKSISKDVVQLNDSFGTIIDTKNNIIEHNYGAQTMACISDIFLTGTNQLAWQTTGIYSNAVDRGLLLGTSGSPAAFAGFPATGTTTITWAGFNYNKIWYQATTGTLFAIVKEVVLSGDQIYTDPTVAYVQNTNLPTPIDAVFHDGGVALLGQSALQTVNFDDADGFAQYYAGYQVANQYPVAYSFFNLFGQLYGFDGTKLFRLPINGGTAGVPEQVAFASGLTLLANSPTHAAFLSAFDNALYVFSGGQSIDKWIELTGLANVQSGAYSVIENALYLQLADSTTLIIRDESLASQLPNAYSAQTVYATDQGTYFVSTANPNQSALWSYEAGSGTPILLKWQSGFVGFGATRYIQVTRIAIALKVPAPASTDITVNYQIIDTGTKTSETSTKVGGSYTATADGYVYLDFRPTQTKGLGVSFGIQCSAKVFLYGITMYCTDGGLAYAIAGSNTLP